MSFQHKPCCLTFFLLWNTKEDILFNRSQWGPKQHCTPLTVIVYQDIFQNIFPVLQKKKSRTGLGYHVGGYPFKERVSSTCEAHYLHPNPWVSNLPQMYRTCQGVVVNKMNSSTACCSKLDFLSSVEHKTRY